MNKIEEKESVVSKVSVVQCRPEGIEKFVKTCKCGTEIRDDQSECIECFRTRNNLKWIAQNEIIFDMDDRALGIEAINFIGINLYYAGYKFEIWYAEGQKSPHLHIKEIPHLEELSPEQLKKYKELFIDKYCPSEYLSFADKSLCTKHLVAQEGLPHFKYKTIKKLMGVWNEDKLNFCDREIYEQLTKTKEYNPNVQSSGITAKIIQSISIVDIARQFGLKVSRNKCLCPFHPDNNTESLVFYEEQGRFMCFGCQTKGNIIKFYAMLKELNPNFKYKKQEVPTQ
jgi:hypothetical protein